MSKPTILIWDLPTRLFHWLLVVCVIGAIISTKIGGNAMLWHGLSEPDPQSVHLLDSKAMFWTGGQKDAAEGIQSFLEKRPAVYPDKVSANMPDFFPWFGPRNYE